MGFRVRERLVEAGCCCWSDQCCRGHSKSNGASLARTCATLTLLVGALLVLASVLRFVANFISEPVLVGFKAGIGLVIVFDQIPKILGIHFARGTFFHIDLSAVTDLEYTALKMLTAAEEKQRKQGVSVWLVGLNPGVLQTVQRSSLSHLPGRDALQFNLELAVAKYQTSRLSAETSG